MPNRGDNRPPEIFKDAVRNVLDQLPMGRKLLYSVRRAKFPKLYDAFLISYPKAGRTWLRCMLGNAMLRHFDVAYDGDRLELLDLSDLHQQIPRIKVAHDDEPQLKAPDDLQSDKSQYATSCVIFLARDPRDIIVSNYFQATKRDKYFEGDISAFIRDETYGFASLVRYMRIWHDNRGAPKAFMLLRYEDMHDDAVGELRRVCDFIGMSEITDEHLRKAAEQASFGAMRKMEEQRKLDTGRLRPGNEDDPESYKVRKGKIGNYPKYLSAADIAYLNDLMRQELPAAYGYEA